jgi:NADH:ubiquinone oxidoreductase subunit 2 (subunit N)
MVFTSVLQSGVAWLALVGVSNSVLQTAYFLRVIHYLYAKAPKNDVDIKEPKKLLVPIYLLVIINIILGIFPALALDLLSTASTSLIL